MNIKIYDLCGKPLDFRICDLCGKPLDFGYRLFKVKESKKVRTEAGIYRKWQTIDIHTDCLNKLLSAVANHKEEDEK